MTKEYLELQKKTQELLHKQIQQQKVCIDDTTVTVLYPYIHRYNEVWCMLIKA